MILITGGTGFIGKKLLSGLIAEGHDIALEKIVGTEEYNLITNNCGPTIDQEKLAYTVHGLVELNADRYQDHPALLTPAKTFSYAEINALANQLARYLKDKASIHKGDRIVLSAGRSENQFIAILAILKLGAVYVPVSFDSPIERLKFIIQDLESKCILHDKNLDGQNIVPEEVDLINLKEVIPLLGKYNDSNLQIPVDPNDLSYIIYTSGTTGQPKGVMIEHQSSINMTLDQGRTFRMSVSDRMLQFAALTFDAAIYETFIAWHSGAALVLLEDGMLSDIDQFVAYIKSKKVSITVLPPSFLNLINPEELDFLRVLITAGEAPNIDMANILAEKLDYYNAYGPTECAVCVSTHQLKKATEENEIIPIGKPISNTKLLLLDDHLDPVPIGVEGELYVTGQGVARGYWNRPELSAEYFMLNPFNSDERMYKTGDIAVLNQDGELEFAGRRDNQIKMRGYRVELDEIEHAVMRLDQVNESAVVAIKDNFGDVNIVSFYTSDTELQSESIQAGLRAMLPHYMIPSQMICLAALPTTPHGKIDKRALKAMKSEYDVEKIFAEPRNEQERQIAELFALILNKQKVGVNESFFEIGGDSIKIVRLFKKLEELYPNKISVVDLFKYPSVEKISKHIGNPKPQLAKEGMDV